MTLCKHDSMNGADAHNKMWNSAISHPA